MVNGQPETHFWPVKTCVFVTLSNNFLLFESGDLVLKYLLSRVTWLGLRLYRGVLKHACRQPNHQRNDQQLCHSSIPLQRRVIRTDQSPTLLPLLPGVRVLESDGVTQLVSHDDRQSRRVETAVPDLAPRDLSPRIFIRDSAPRGRFDPAARKGSSTPRRCGRGWKRYRPSDR